MLIAGLGGFLGTCLRYLVGRYIHHIAPAANFPWGTFAVNVVGSLLIGLLYGLAERHRLLSPALSALLITGFCGGLTTFSSFSDDLYRLRLNREELDPFIRVLLRLYSGIFQDFKPIDEREIATWSGYTVERVHQFLQTLWRLRVIRYIPSNRAPMLYLHEERLPKSDLYIAPETYLRRRELMEERFEQMDLYAQNEEECRSSVLDRYFGAGSAHRCGICDICLRKRREEKARRGETQADEATLREQIIATLQANPTEPHALLQRLKASPERASELLRQLLEEGLITQSGEGLLKISDR